MKRNFRLQSVLFLLGALAILSFSGPVKAQSSRIVETQDDFFLRNPDNLESQKFRIPKRYTTGPSGQGTSGRGCSLEEGGLAGTRLSIPLIPRSPSTYRSDLEKLKSFRGVLDDNTLRVCSFRYAYIRSEFDWKTFFSLPEEHHHKLVIEVRDITLGYDESGDFVCHKKDVVYSTPELKAFQDPDISYQTPGVTIVNQNKDFTDHWRIIASSFGRAGKYKYEFKESEKDRAAREGSELVKITVDEVLPIETECDVIIYYKNSLPISLKY